MLAADFPDVESAARLYLLGCLAAAGDGTGVSTERKPPTARLVQCYVSGGALLNIAQDGVNITVSAWDVRTEPAARLAQQTRRWLQSLDNTPVLMPDGTTAYLTWQSEAGRPVSNPHPETALSRYQHTQAVSVCGIF